MQEDSAAEDDSHNTKDMTCRQADLGPVCINSREVQPIVKSCKTQKSITAQMAMQGYSEKIKMWYKDIITVIDNSFPHFIEQTKSD